jgi:hypothetical protein
MHGAFRARLKGAAAKKSHSCMANPAVGTDGCPGSSSIKKSQLLNVTARSEAILDHGTPFGIRIASFDLHLPTASQAGEKVRPDAFALFDGLDRHGGRQSFQWPGDRISVPRWGMAFRS